MTAIEIIKIALGWIVAILSIPFITFRSITGIGWHHEEIIKKHIEAVKAGDYEAAAKIELLSSAEQVKSDVEQYPILKDFDSYEITKVKNPEFLDWYGPKMARINVVYKQGDVEMPFIYTIRYPDAQIFSLGHDIFYGATNAINTTKVWLDDERVEKIMQIEDILVSDEVNEEGIVSEAKTTIPSDAKTIYINSRITDAIKDRTCRVAFNLKPDDLSMQSSENSLDQSGEAIAKFSFTRPTYGWPKGEYEFYTMCSPNTSTKKVMVTIE